MKYKRILLKLSGESLLGSQSYGIDAKVLESYSLAVKEVVDAGVEVAVVIGGGNIFRGVQGAQGGVVDRATGDYMGMLATMMNAMALQGAFERVGLSTRLLSAIKMEQVAEPFIRRRAMRHLEKGRVVIFGAGTGNPYFTTDTAASLRAVEIEADVVIKGTRVDGIYDSDPEKNPNAVKYDEISFKKVYDLGLEVMDLTAITLCQENNKPIVVFDMNTPGNLMRLVSGEKPTVIYFVRHGETILTPERRFSGGDGSDPELSDEGIAQAEAVGKELAARKADLIIASPMVRTKQTADAIAKATGLKVTYDEAWREAGFGEWDGLTIPQVKELYPNEWLSWVSSTGAVAGGGAPVCELLSALLQIAGAGPRGG